MRRTSISRHSGTQGWAYAALEATKPTRSTREETYLRVFLHGDQGEVLWGWHQAAVVAAWRAAPAERGDWTLTATVARVERVYLQQKPLLFTAPKLHGPPWCWPVLEVTVQGTTLRARMGPAEQ